MITRQKARELRSMIEKASASLSDTDALDAIELFPHYVVNHPYALGDRFSYGDKLYKVLQAHTSQEQWAPDSTPSLYAEVEKPGQGDTPDNPIPYNNNMELFEGKYYSQYDVVYHCTRSTGVPVYNDLRDLVYIYVEVVE